MKTLKHGHRGTGKANKVPRSATFKSKQAGVGQNHTFSAASKKRK